MSDPSTLGSIFPPSASKVSVSSRRRRSLSSTSYIASPSASAALAAEAVPMASAIVAKAHLDTSDSTSSFKANALKDSTVTTNTTATSTADREACRRGAFDEGGSLKERPQQQRIQSQKSYMIMASESISAPLKVSPGASQSRLNSTVPSAATNTHKHLKDQQQKQKLQEQPQSLSSPTTVTPKTCEQHNLAVGDSTNSFRSTKNSTNGLTLSSSSSNTNINGNYYSNSNSNSYSTMIRKDKKPVPNDLHILPSSCGRFTLVSELYSVPLKDGPGLLPMDRRCMLRVYGHPERGRGAVLLIPGFSSNRACFDVGGGQGKGSSFIEYLAYRGYDAYSLDLRGTRQAREMGCRSPAFLKEHVESDVPSAINLIKSIGHEKVYLIGHSMGGAISCAVAGFIPQDIAGIVHLAGLYHYSLPYIREIVDVYKSYCPEFVRGIVRTGSAFVAKSALRILRPAISTVFNLLNPPPQLPALGNGVTSSSDFILTVDNNSSGGSDWNDGSDTGVISNSLRHSVELKCPTALQSISQNIPAGFLSTPTPTINIVPPPPLPSVTPSLPSSSSPLLQPSPPQSRRSQPSLSLVAPKPNAVVATMYSFMTELRRRPIPVRTFVELFLVLRKFLPSALEKVLINRLMYPSPWMPYTIENPWSLLERAVESPTIGIYLGITKMAVQDEVYNNWLKFSSTYRAEVRQIEDCKIAKPAVISISATPSSSSSSKSNSRSNDDDEASAMKQTFGGIESTRVSGHNSGDGGTGGDMHGVNADPVDNARRETLRKVLSNAMSSLQTESLSASLQSGELSGSAFTSPIPHPYPTSSSSSPPPLSSSTSSSQSNSNRNSSSNRKEQHPEFSSWNELGPYLSRFEQLEHLPLFFCHANRDAVIHNEDTMAGYRRSGSRWKAVIEYSGEVAATVTDKYLGSETGAGGSTQHGQQQQQKSRIVPASLSLTPLVESHVSTPSSSSAPASSSSSTKGKAAGAFGASKPLPSGLSDRYEVSGNVSYGHCDILGGKDADKVWERIADWLDATSTREKEWKFKRRYSAK